MGSPGAAGGELRESRGRLRSSEELSVPAVESSTKRDVGVVLINWNGAEDTVPCIESLLAGSVKPDAIVVVDNASRDDSADLISQKFPDVKLIRNRENTGFTGANNQGINLLIEQGYRYIWVLNNDTIVDTGCLASLKDHMEHYSDVAACTAKILYADGARLIWYGGAVFNKWTVQITHRGAGEKDKGQFDSVEDVPFISGCCLFVRRDAFHRVGLFDEHFFAYAEDGDWCFRARKKNLKLQYVPKAVIWHKVSAAMRKIKKRSTKGMTSPFVVYITSRNRVFLVRKHCQNVLQLLTASLSSAVWFVYYGCILLLLARFDKFRALCTAIYDGITVSLNVESKPFHRYLP